MPVPNRRRSVTPPFRPTLDSIHFDTSGLEPQGDVKPGQIRVWHTPEGDGLGLFLFTIPPDFPPGLRSVAEIAAFYEEMVRPSGGRFIDAAFARLRGVPVIRTVLATPQQPTGLTFVGSLTLPFRDFSFVVKVQCAEHGITGIRETVLMDRSLARPEAPRPNPYSKQFDAEFPDHPLSRARRVLAKMGSSLKVDEGIAALPVFPIGPELGT